MIKYIKRIDLDIEKYNACIENSHNSRVYAYSWYLDIVATNWDALILDDYKAVMPLPWRQKYFIKYVYPPCWTQQLGVFSSDVISEGLVERFLKAIPRKFKKITIQLNSKNPILGKKVVRRVNYILPLDKPYGEIILRYNKNRKRVLKKARENQFIIDTNLKKDKFLDFYLAIEKNYTIDLIQLKALKGLLNTEKKGINIWGVNEEVEGLVAALIWLKNKHRITYLLPVANVKGNKMGAPSFLIDKIIEQYAESDFIFDFEGSMIEGVANFYRSFGAVDEGYALYAKKKF